MKSLRDSRNIDPKELKLLEEALNRFYENPPKAYHEEARQGNADWNVPELVFHRRITDHAYAGAKILDVGCGAAMACPWFIEKGAHYAGVDISEEQLEANRSKYPKCNFLKMHWRDIPKLGAVYDFVVSFFVLEHMVYPREFLKASASCVRTGGFLSVLCPDYLDRGSMPSQHFFGIRPGGIKAKIRGYQWIEAFIEVIDRYIVYPRLIRKARSMSESGGAWLINLRPVCLEVESWATDWDAVYMVGEDEVSRYIEDLEFRIIERGAVLRKSSHSENYPNLCYVLAQKS